MSSILSNEMLGVWRNSMAIAERDGSAEGMPHCFLVPDVMHCPAEAWRMSPWDSIPWRFVYGSWAFVCERCLGHSWSRFKMQAHKHVPKAQMRWVAAIRHCHHRPVLRLHWSPQMRDWSTDARLIPFDAVNLVDAFHNNNNNNDSTNNNNSSNNSNNDIHTISYYKLHIAYAILYVILYDVISYPCWARLSAGQGEGSKDMLFSARCPGDCDGHVSRPLFGDSRRAPRAWSTLLALHVLV